MNLVIEMFASGNEVKTVWRFEQWNKRDVKVSADQKVARGKTPLMGVLFASRNVYSGFFKKNIPGPQKAVVKLVYGHNSPFVIGVVLDDPGFGEKLSEYKNAWVLKIEDKIKQIYARGILKNESANVKNIQDGTEFIVTFTAPRRILEIQINGQSEFPPQVLDISEKELALVRLILSLSPVQAVEIIDS